MGLHIVKALEILHSVGFCHQDLKPDNITFNSKNRSYNLIDFGFAQRIGLKRYTTGFTFKGNSMFASVRKYRMTPNVLPIDDIESIFYLIAFFYLGFTLPWLQDYI